MRASAAISARGYGGISAEDRRAQRRTRLVDAGTEVIGTRGFRSCTIRDFCRGAHLNERYFYESFADREDYLLAVYEAAAATVSTRVVAALEAQHSDPAAGMRAAIGSFVRTLTENRRLAQILLFEVVGVNETLERRRREVIRMFAELVLNVGRKLRPSLADVDKQVARAAALMLVGGINELLIDWLLDSSDAEPEALIEAMVIVAQVILEGLTE